MTGGWNGADGIRPTHAPAEGGTRAPDGRTERGRGRPRSFDREKALRRALEIFWRHGYASASVASLCRAMGINAPSLYAAFGNKSALFREALEYYRRHWWADVAKAFLNAPVLRGAVENFFRSACRILLSPDSPRGGLVILSATAGGDAEPEVAEAIRCARADIEMVFVERLCRAAADREIPQETDIISLAGALNIFLEGLSLRARSDVRRQDLEAVAALAVRLLP